jgi:hypothetical protein
MVNIEVVVTDRDEVRVTGLRPQDFLLLVDGLEVPIEDFTEVHELRIAVEDKNGATATTSRSCP